MDQQKEIADFLQKTTQEIIDGLEQPVSEIKVSQEEGVFKIHLQSSQPGILIGFKGKNLNSLQTILGLAVLKKFGPEVRILVDVNDYRKEQEEKLKSLALEAAERAKLEKKPIALAPMSAFERRLIHLFLAPDPQLETISEGEGEQRHIVVKSKIKS